MMALTDELLQTIKTTLASSLDESLVESVLKRLDSFGYKVQESDALLVGFAIQKVENHIKNECNILEIPDGLLEIAVDMICGEFLFTKKQTGQLEIGDLDLNGAVASIKEGDTQVNFTGASDEDKVNTFLNYLMNNGKGDFICYRKMQW
jgi:hypothetical protein